MAVGASNLALGDFREDSFPASALADHPGNLAGLVANVIELEDLDIRQPAIDAGMVSEIVPQLLAEFGAHSSDPGVDLRVMPLSVGGMPQTRAISTPGLAPILRLLSLVELAKRLDQPAGAAPLI
jgi:hypothetical protein